MSRHRRGIPAVFDVEHLPFNGTGADDYGNDVESWGEPDPRKFVTFIDPQSDELDLPGHIRDSVDVGIIVLPDFGPVSPRDREVIDGTVYDVVGQPKDYTRIPSLTGGGCYVVTLKVVKSS
ncbi:hypothetical protein [Gordonia westfalica]|uniref:Head-to-tail stopper n=1 Tax=Gordonia westfalica TaxID=158898 RepID=A0A1H2E3P6_9ACTN|nr:hypothetical protein [Gordonia westfalica]SDT85094.1 hypothetical protein SAMN04488548_11512 [Gordonia westfalica]SDT86138.1 hypothetical protein SAMN04488548_1229 [Gordonia westfalica]SDT86181.1 hypothetical protein SAMN04488548_12217 [Gordonia westfalica]SDT88328.1 hypothetical protein SAMN04488548_1266 [Gordonia westfalica]SDT88398.1 hypothetical protein SAMN04488548_12612 [Gordonia westfalica]